MALRRGFKTEANHIAREVRAELGLRFIDPLDPWALARHLEIPIVPLSSYAGPAADAVHHFCRVDPGAFSALTVFDGPRRLCRRWDSLQEEEANWLAGALLISEEAALQIARSGEPLDEAAKRCRVSQAMITFRLNVTGALRRVGDATQSRAAAKRVRGVSETER